MSTSIRVDKNVPMKTRDGVILRADVYRPDDGGRHPAIIIRTPYSKNYRARAGDFISPVEAAFAGYAVVAQDCRGRYESEGQWPVQSEGLDGYDTVEWAASEPWCDGNIGMSGGSYVANVQWMAAAEKPPHLKAINPCVCQSGPAHESTLSGGMPLELITSWFMFTAGDHLNKLEQRGVDVSEHRRLVERALNYPEEVYSHLPLAQVPHFQIEGLSEMYAYWVKSRGQFDELGSEDPLYWPYHEVEVPCCHTGGWFDDYAGSSFVNFLGMRNRGGSERAREGQHVLYGPWVHAAGLPAYSGGLHFGPAASGNAARVHEHHMAYFDRYVRGRDIDVPAVRYFVMGSNRWATADDWPIPGTEWRRMYLHSRGRAHGAAGDGQLSWDPPTSEAPDTYLYDPGFPVPTLGGRTVPHGSLAPGPLDQYPIEQRPDVLCYTSPEIEDDLEVTGPLMMQLFAATSAPDTDFMAKLVDVYPDGAAYPMADGYIRARYRESPIRPKALEPGTVYEFRIDMAATSVTFRRGHRIRVEIASSNFPKIDRNMNTGNPFGEDAAGAPAIQTVFHQEEYPSHILLPVIPPRADR